MNAKPKNVPKNIRCLALPSDLVFPAEEGWSAVALELDIWGFGETKKQAMDELEEMIKAQIEFAFSSEGNPAILNHPTEKRFFKMWDDLEKLDKNSEVKKGMQKSMPRPAMKKEGAETYLCQAA